MRRTLVVLLLLLASGLLLLDSCKGPQMDSYAEPVEGPLFHDGV